MYLASGTTQHGCLWPLSVQMAVRLRRRQLRVYLLMSLSGDRISQRNGRCSSVPYPSNATPLSGGTRPWLKSRWSEKIGGLGRVLNLSICCCTGRQCRLFCCFYLKLPSGRCDAQSPKPQGHRRTTKICHRPVSVSPDTLCHRPPSVAQRSTHASMTDVLCIGTPHQVDYVNCVRPRHAVHANS